MPVQITTIKFRIGEKEIELTSDEARKIHEELSRLFSNETTPAPVVIPQPYLVPYWPQPQPIVVEPWQPWWQPSWQITCQTLCIST